MTAAAGTLNLGGLRNPQASSNTAPESITNNHPRQSIVWDWIRQSDLGNRFEQAYLSEGLNYENRFDNFGVFTGFVRGWKTTMAYADYAVVDWYRGRGKEFGTKNGFSGFKLESVKDYSKVAGTGMYWGGLSLLTATGLTQIYAIWNIGRLAKNIYKNREQIQRLLAAYRNSRRSGQRFDFVQLLQNVEMREAAMGAVFSATVYAVPAFEALRALPILVNSTLGTLSENMLRNDKDISELPQSVREELFKIRSFVNGSRVVAVGHGLVHLAGNAEHLIQKWNQDNQPVQATLASSASTKVQTHPEQSFEERILSQQNSTQTVYSNDIQGNVETSTSSALHPETVELPAVSFVEHTISSGESLNAIAHQYGFENYKALIPFNPQITNPDLIHAGQIIRIPNHDELLPAIHDDALLAVQIHQGDTVETIAENANVSPQVVQALNPSFAVSPDFHPQIAIVPNQEYIDQNHLNVVAIAPQVHVDTNVELQPQISNSTNLELTPQIHIENGVLLDNVNHTLTPQIAFTEQPINTNDLQVQIHTGDQDLTPQISTAILTPFDGHPQINTESVDLQHSIELKPQINEVNDTNTQEVVLSPAISAPKPNDVEVPYISQVNTHDSEIPTPENSVNIQPPITQPLPVETVTDTQQHGGAISGIFGPATVAHAEGNNSTNLEPAISHDEPAPITSQVNESVSSSAFDHITTHTQNGLVEATTDHASSFNSTNDSFWSEKGTVKVDYETVPVNYRHYLGKDVDSTIEVANQNGMTNSCVIFATSNALGNDKTNNMGLFNPGYIGELIVKKLIARDPGFIDYLHKEYGVSEADKMIKMETPGDVSILTDQAMQYTSTDLSATYQPLDEFGVHYSMLTASTYTDSTGHFDVNEFSQSIKQNLDDGHSMLLDTDAFFSKQGLVMQNHALSVVGFVPASESQSGQDEILAIEANGWANRPTGREDFKTMLDLLDYGTDTGEKSDGSVINRFGLVEFLPVLQANGERSNHLIRIPVNDKNVDAFNKLIIFE